VGLSHVNSVGYCRRIKPLDPTDRDTYVKVLTEFKNLNSNLDPITVMTDFEEASALAFRKIYPDTYQQGCLPPEPMYLASYAADNRSSRTCYT